MTLITLLFIAVCALAATTGLLWVRICSTHRELRRTRKRMWRLDAIANDVAAGEMVARATPEPTPELPARVPQIKLLRDAAKYRPITGAPSSESDDDFAAPRLTAPPDHVQHPGRARCDTAVGSPRRLMPREKHPTVAVGSILIRME